MTGVLKRADDRIIGRVLNDGNIEPLVQGTDRLVAYVSTP